MLCDFDKSRYIFFSHFTQLRLPRIVKWKSLSSCLFPFEKVLSLSNNLQYYDTNYMAFKKSYEVTLLSKSYRIALKFSKMLSLYCKTIELKTFNLDLLSLISNNTPNLYSVICSKMNMIPITNVILLYNKVRSHKFMFVWKLLAFIAHRFYNPIMFLGKYE